MINQTLDQMRDPAQAVVFKGKPDDAAPAISPASTVIAVKDDATPINGYYPALNFGLKPVWVSAKTLAPYKSASDPTAQCQPGVKADGHLGFIFTH
ncbi:hypothetical protein GOB93_15610 [Acetobacter musti]|uniref:Uncharacterized protein n=1 Tax=Acetobacter musti TaxID=864732 RepID=A0ABX0JRY4_9PROT|nr:hypothetical protein [Acetobacter musti]NHN86057.1 hypothetical protein [Acetobacter musti]